MLTAGFDNNVLKGIFSQEDLFRNIVEDLADMVFVKDLDARYIAVNKAFATVVGRPKNGIIGKTDTEIFGPEFAAQIARLELQLLGANTPLEYELSYSMGESPMVFQSRKLLLRDELGEPKVIVGVSRDLTRQKEAETKYRFIFDNAPIAFWEEDFSEVKTIINRLKASGIADFRQYFAAHPDVLNACISGIKIVDVNLATMRMNRVRNKPRLIADLQRNFTLEFQPIFVEEFVALAEGRNHYQSAASTIDVAGETLDVLFQMNVLPGHEESLSSVLISVTDITALKRTEVQLSQIKELYRSVVQRQTEMICRFGATGKVSFFNDAFKSFFGTKGLNLSDVTFQELFPEGGEQDCASQLIELTAERTGFQMEVYNYDAHNAIVWQHWSINALFGADGSLEEYQAVGSDITARKDADARLSASEERWRSVFENAEDLILTVNSSGLILSANEPASKAVGYKMAGSILTKILNTDNALIAQRAIHEVFSYGRRVQEEIRVVNGLYAGKHLNCVMTPIWHGERVLTATIIARDITESRKLENRVREALIEGQENERKRVSRELHDGLGQLFTAIKLNIQHLRSGVMKNDAESIAKRLQLLEHNLGVAIEEVKHISHNLMPDVLEQFGLIPALQDLVKNWNSAGDITITLEIVGLDYQLPPQMELALFRMAQELITNAVRHSGALSIFVQLIDHTTTLILMVEDDGQGFNPLAEGKGLGLRNIQSRAELLDGTVYIDSAPNKGTVTTIEIPLKTDSTKP